MARLLRTNRPETPQETGMRNAAPAAAAGTQGENRPGEAEGSEGPLVGIIANPVSARDIRRVVANANSLQLADRVNIVLRALAALAACGVRRVLIGQARASFGQHGFASFK